MCVQQSLFAFNEKSPAGKGADEVLSSARLTLAGLASVSQGAASVSVSAEAFPQKQLRFLARGLDIEIQCIPLSRSLILQFKEALVQNKEKEPVRSLLCALRGLKLSYSDLLESLEDPQSPWRELPCFFEHLLKGRTLYVVVNKDILIGPMGEKRSLVESFCGTRLLHRDEFVVWCTEMKATTRKLRGSQTHWTLKPKQHQGGGH